MRYTTCIVAIMVVFGVGNTSLATTVGYWRFEEGPDMAPVPHATAPGVFDPTVVDVSGSGNNLSAWTEGTYAGYAFRSDVPFANVPKTGAANNFSIKNTGDVPGLFSNSSLSSPTGIALDTWMPSAFTIEVSWKPEAGGYRTVVGRDARNVATTNGDLAALYLQAQPDNSMAIKFADVTGAWHQAISAPGLINGFDFPTDPDGVNGTWYNIAAVSTGSTLKLYVNGSLAASEPIVSADPRLAIGTTSGGDWHAGGWSVGRGLYGGGHGDRAYGYIDEVRISDTALTSADLLYQLPPTLSLQVNTTTGAVTLKNNAANAVAVDFYQIASAASALNFANWNSLDHQNYDAVDGPDVGSTPGDSAGEGWDQGGGSNNSQLIEYFLASAGSSIAAGELLSLGNAFNTSIFGSGNNGDLEFTFGLVGGQLLTGNVSYISGGGVAGDYNGDGIVNAADYVVWRDTLGSHTDLRANGDNTGASAGVIDQADYVYWKTRFGNTSGSGSATAAAAVPEPNMFALLIAAVVTLNCGRPKRG